MDPLLFLHAVQRVFRDKDGFQVVHHHHGEKYTVTRGDQQCLDFETRDVGSGGAEFEIVVYGVSRCGSSAESGSGHKLLQLLDTLALSTGARAIVLMDESRIHGCTGGVSLSHLLVLATGQTYYNQFGYLAMTAPRQEDEGGGSSSGDTKKKNDTRSSAHFRAVEDRAEERAVQRHNQRAIDRPFADVAPNLLQNAAATAFFASRGMSMDDGTSRQLFSELFRPSPAANLCGNRALVLWMRAVIRQLFSGTAAAPMRFRGTDMVKPFWPASATGGGRRRPTQRRRRSRRGTTRRASKI